MTLFKRPHGMRRPSALLVILLALFSQCKDETPQTQSEIVTAQLTSAEAWQNPIVTVDDVDYSSLYKDFSIAFTSTAYTTTAGTPVWKPSGTWKFTDDQAKVMKLDDAMEVTINSITDTELVLELLWDKNTFEPGRKSSVKGKNKFKFKKK